MLVEDSPLDNDIKRLAAHAAIVAMENKLSPKQAEELAQLAGSAYFKAILDFKGSRPTGLSALDENTAPEPILALIKTAEANTQEKLLAKYTVDGRNFRFKKDELERVPNDVRAAVVDALRGLPDGNPLKGAEVFDVASKPHSGGNSRGLDRYLVTIADKNPAKPAHILVIKEEISAPTTGHNPDLTNVDIAQLVDYARELGVVDSSVTAGTTIHHNGFLIKELQPAEDSLDLTKLGFDDLKLVVQGQANVVALNHLRSVGKEALVNWIGNEAGKMSKKLGKFAMAYQAENELDRAEMEAQARKQKVIK
jgi:hypothetical protein